MQPISCLLVICKCQCLHKVFQDLLTLGYEHTVVCIWHALQYAKVCSARILALLKSNNMSPWKSLYHITAVLDLRWGGSCIMQ